MPTPQVTLDEQPIEFVIPGSQGFSIDILEAQVLLEDISDTWKKDFREYREPLKAKLLEKTGATLSDAQLFKFVEAVSSAYVAFKKKLDSELPLALGLDATPSPSPSGSSSY